MGRRAAAMAVMMLGLLVAPAGATSTQGAPATSSGTMPFHIDRLTESFAGTAAEVIQVSGYTYVAVRTDGGELRWAVTLHKPIAVGAAVQVRSFGTQEHFKSPRLGREFSKLWFAIVST